MSSLDLKGFQMASHRVRALVLALAVALGVGVVGVSAASAMPDPPPPADGPLAPSVPVPGPAGVMAGSGFSPGEIAEATVNGLRVRSGPGTQKAVLGLLGKGDRVKLIGAKQDRGGQIWHKVVLQDRSAYGLPRGYIGWVTAAYLY
ncbi:SH3 domain-containing protein [Streptomyces sp. NPDC059063]|uniref:SH3 domain-containing protein n=1 Tax=unclassified Streptomyces TaxID=2593676 RepID=UPI00368B1A95